MLWKLCHTANNHTPSAPCESSCVSWARQIFQKIFHSWSRKTVSCHAGNSCVPPVRHMSWMSLHTEYRGVPSLVTLGILLWWIGGTRYVSDCPMKVNVWLFSLLSWVAGFTCLLIKGHLQRLSYIVILLPNYRLAIISFLTMEYWNQTLQYSLGSILTNCQWE